MFMIAGWRVVTVLWPAWGCCVIVLSSSDRWRGIRVYDVARIGHVEGYVQYI